MSKIQKYTKEDLPDNLKIDYNITLGKHHLGGYAIADKNGLVRAIPIKYGNHRRKWVSDNKINRVKIYKTKLNAKNAMRHHFDLRRAYSDNFDNIDLESLRVVKLTVAYKGETYK